MAEGSVGRSSEECEVVEGVTSGQAVPIVHLKEGGGFYLDEEALRRILLRDEVKDKPVVVVSVAGAFRQGKSFLLNFFLRYMRCEGQGDWLGDASIPLEGFYWRGGSEPITTGILLWSQVFLVTRSDGREVAVLLMDTQGAFDSYTTVNDVATIFALSTMTSSVQVYNLSRNIQEDDLEHLQFFTEYGRMAQSLQGHQSLEKQFQKLVFLVRDWAHESHAKYGAAGGTYILEHCLDPSLRDSEQQELRCLIKTSFAELGCFLLPYPGHQVATGQFTEGCLPDMEDDFKHHLREFVALVLAKDKLVTKRINGEEISCEEWVTYFSKYASIFSGDELPRLKSVLEVTAEMNNEMALNKAKKIYMDGMEMVCGPNKPVLSDSDLLSYHKIHLKAALNSFASAPKMGGEECSHPYWTRLEKEIAESFNRFVRINAKGSNFFESASRSELWQSMKNTIKLQAEIFGIVFFPLKLWWQLSFGLLWSYRNPDSHSRKKDSGPDLPFASWPFEVHN